MAINYAHQCYPYWTVEGRTFTNFTHAEAFAHRMALEADYDIPVMEKLDEFTPAYAVVTKSPPAYRRREQ